jgi:flavin-dependent dehydrogenase
MVERQAHEYLSSYISLLQKRGRVLTLIGKPSYRGITLHAPTHISGARVLLVGDTAGQVKPLTGGGLYFGLLCADIAAAILHQAIEKDGFSAGNMRLYDKKCQSMIGRELRLGWWGHRLYSRLSDERVEWLARWAQRNNLPARLSASSRVGFDWHGSAMLNMLKEVTWPFRKQLDGDTSSNIPMERETDA